MTKGQLNEILTEGQRVLRLEAEAIFAAAERLDSSFVDSVERIHGQLVEGGKIIVSGVGKSGNVAQKLAATLTSTGSMAVFLHPTEALHGGLGLIGPKDVFLLFSHSGSTEELLAILPSVKRSSALIVSVLGNPHGALAKHSDVVIHANVPKEACPNNLAPTTSSTLQMAIGDALAMCLQTLVGFSEENFARLHPGGRLGRQLHTRVSDLMHSGKAMARLLPDATMDQVVIALTDYRLSGVCIFASLEPELPAGKKLLGVITEGDLRRALFKRDQFFSLQARDIMTSSPITVRPELMASDALKVMENRDQQLSFLPVVTEAEECVGVLRLHDLVLAGLA